MSTRTVGAVWLLGTALLRRSLSAPPDSTEFYTQSLATAATFAVGGTACGPPRFAADRPARTALTATATGVGAFGVFYGCALIARRIPILNRAITDVLGYARFGTTPRALAVALINGAAEEMFFRGPVYDASGKHPVATSTVVYCLTTGATGNPALTLAAALMGTLFALERRTTGGIGAPLLTHLTWSTLMVRYLPPLFPITPSAAAATKSS
ncbi:CPBP family intramembrane glutamic endopeptidase [Nocardia sp. NPDC003482]